jgi:hypothetical protein
VGAHQMVAVAAGGACPPTHPPLYPLPLLMCLPNRLKPMSFEEREGWDRGIGKGVSAARTANGSWVAGAPLPAARYAPCGAHATQTAGSKRLEKGLRAGTHPAACKSKTVPCLPASPPRAQPTAPSP